jgi:hypothetical protein
MTSPTLDWQLLADEYHRRNTDGVISAIRGFGLISPDEGRDELAHAVTETPIWEEASKSLEGSTLLAYGLYAIAMQEWELTIEHPAIKTRLTKAKAAWEAANKGKPHNVGDYARATNIIMSLTDSVIDGMDVENAVNNSCVYTLEEKSTDIVNRCTKIKPKPESLENCPYELRNLLENIFDDDKEYYQVLKSFAGTMLDYQNSTMSRHQLVAKIDDTIDELRNLEKNLQPDVSASELPAYRQVLRAVRCQLKKEPYELIKFESVRFRYFYSFSLDEIEDGCACEMAIKVLTGDGSHRVAGVLPGPAQWAARTDLLSWGVTKSPQRNTVEIPMPNLYVNRQDRQELRNFRVKILIGASGQHLLEIEHDLAEPQLRDINQGLRRPSAFMGRELIISDESCDQGNDVPANERSMALASWSRLPHYANDVIRDIRALINQSASVSEGINNDSESPEEINNGSKSDFRTTLEIRRAWICGSDGTRTDATPGDVKRLANLLLQPLNRLATAPEEWMCYRVPANIQNLIKDDSFASDLAMSRGNTTVLYMPATPDWLIRSYNEVLESFASLPVQPNSSSRQLQNEADAAYRALMDDHEFDDDSTEAEKRIDALTETRRRVQKAIDQARQRRVKLSSSEIIGHSHQRALFENLMAVGRVPELRDELDSSVERADQVYNRVVEREQHLRERRGERAEQEHQTAEQKHQTALQWLLFLVGLFSFAGVITLVEQELYKAESQGIWKEDNPVLNSLLSLAAYVAVVAGGVALMVYLSRRYRIKTRSSGVPGSASPIPKSLPTAPKAS